MNTNVINSIQNQIDSIKIGTIFYTCWGYEQTNVNFFQVIERKGSTVIIREVNQNRFYDGSMSGSCTPLKDDFIGEPLRKRISKSATLKISDCERASLYNNQKLYFSSYA